MSIEFPFISVEDVSPHPSDPCHEVWFDEDLEHAEETAGHLGHKREIYLSWKAIKAALPLLDRSVSDLLYAMKQARTHELERTGEIERYKLAP